MEFLSDKEILTSMVSKGQEYSLISPDENVLEMLEHGELTQNQYILFLSVFSYVFSTAHEKMREIYRNMDIDTATGEGLDNIGKLFNVERGLGQPAIVELNIELPIARDENLIIPEGTLVIFEELYMTDADYITSYEITVPAGVTSITAQAESTAHIYQRKIPEGCIKGLAGFDDISVTNTHEGTTGKNIEEDIDYRQRIKKTQTANTKSSKPAIDNYLANYQGLNSYILIPCFDGIGTLKIICDTIPSKLEEIANDVYYNCMLFTDEMPVAELPDTKLVESIKVYISTITNAGLTIDEIKQLVISHVKIFVEGGMLRDMTTYAGMSIGESFIPSQLSRFLMSNVMEIENCYFTREIDGTETVWTDIIEVEPTQKIKLDTVEVVKV